MRNLAAALKDDRSSREHSALMVIALVALGLNCGCSKSKGEQLEVSCERSYRAGLELQEAMKGVSFTLAKEQYVRECRVVVEGAVASACHGLKLGSTDAQACAKAAEDNARARFLFDVCARTGTSQQDRDHCRGEVVNIDAESASGPPKTSAGDDDLGRMTDSEMVASMAKKARDSFPAPGAIIERTLLAKGQLHGKPARVERIKFTDARAGAHCEYGVYEYDAEWRRYTGVLFTIGYGMPEGACDYGWQRVCIGCSLTGQDKFTYVDFKEYLEKEGFNGPIAADAFETKEPLLKGMRDALAQHYQLRESRKNRAAALARLKPIVTTAKRFSKTIMPPSGWCNQAVQTLRPNLLVFTSVASASRQVLEACRAWGQDASTPKRYAPFKEVCMPSPSTALEALAQATTAEDANTTLQALCPDGSLWAGSLDSHAPNGDSSSTHPTVIDDEPSTTIARTNRKEPVSKLVAATPEVVGALDARAIHKIIVRNVNQLRYCHESQLKHHPQLEGEVTVKFTITSGGSVDSSNVVQSTMGNSELETCVAGRIRTWAFPKPQRDGVSVVTYPFVFERAPAP